LQRSDAVNIVRFFWISLYSRTVVILQETHSFRVTSSALCMTVCIPSRWHYPAASTWTARRLVTQWLVEQFARRRRRPRSRCRGSAALHASMSLTAPPATSLTTTCMCVSVFTLTRCLLQICLFSFVF